MANNTKSVAISTQEDLVIILRRLTTRTLHQMREETGETDFTSDPSSFYFSNRTIAAEIGGSSSQVKDVIMDSDLDYVHKNGEVLVWLDDLEERLEAFVK